MGFVISWTKNKFQLKEIFQIILNEILCREKSIEFFEEEIIEKSFEFLTLTVQKFKQEFFEIWRQNDKHLKKFTGILW